ncbi:hypothetical protein [Alkalibacterium sp. 20]|uniref:hypothetical protein n=1 Tax=Alkalibacterium sp. 20 TaxID=1798803 RepID=UPI0009001AF4|nr:hypothetical protein [Alkalibacterium sp. 20]OJF90997.1 hypothetical protein AX762_11465 [Alkalibacterium sp. 20]
MSFLRKFVVTFLAFSIFISSGGYVFASNDADPEIPVAIEDLSTKQIQELADEWSVDPEEIEELDDNLAKAFTEIEDDFRGHREVKISENLYLEERTEEITLLNNPLEFSTYSTQTRKTVSTSRLIRNRLNKVVLTLKATGVFVINGSTTSPADVYGTYDTFWWTVKVPSTAKGPKVYNSWVRVSFEAKVKIGIAPIDISINSFSTVATLNMNAKGSFTSTWR